MAAPLIRIFSDIHYGDPASRVRRLVQLRPLLDGVGHLVLNGDTLDTRPGPRPAYTAECRAAVEAFFGEHAAATTYLTGNHDPDLSPRHSLDLADGQVFATHGDILFDNIVPWSIDAAASGQAIAAALAPLPPAARADLATRYAIWRQVAATTLQRHQSEPRGLSYTLKFIGDTVWPPTRVLRVLGAWRAEGPLAAAFLGQHRPRAKFVLLGHTHRPTPGRVIGGIVAINTGSFCQPFGGCVVDLQPGRLAVRRTEFRAGEFRPGRILASYPLA